VASEVGYRAQPVSFLSADATLFRHRYDRLRSQDAPPGGGIPILIGNTLNGESKGIEVELVVQPVSWWRTHASYTRLTTEISRDANSRDVSGGVNEANDPRHMFGVRASLDLHRSVEVDARLRSIGALPNPAVPAYTELALRVGWRASSRVELAVVGEDLLHDQHPEFGAAVPQRVEFERGVRAILTLRLP
jgi:iron complex outermembrane recepter protein